MPGRKKSRGPEPVSRILDDALRQLGLEERLQERSVLSLWPRIVGEKIAAHSRPVDITDGVLTLAADHGAWRQEITMLLPLILEKFRAACGPEAVREIRWQNQPRHSGPKRHGRT